MKARPFFFLLVAAFVVWFLIVVRAGAGDPTLPTTSDPEPPPAPPVDRTVQGRNVDEWHAVAARHLASARHWHSAARRYRDELLVHWHPTVEYAYTLAAAVFGVPRWELRAVGSCESSHYVYAQNGRYKGVMQLGWAPFGLSPFDPIANVLSAAQTVAHDGSWRQWECKP